MRFQAVGPGHEIRASAVPFGVHVLQSDGASGIDRARPLGARAHWRHGGDRPRPFPAVGRLRAAVRFRCARRHDRVQESARAAQLALGSRAEFRRDLHVRRGRGARRSGGGALRNLPRAGPRDAAILVAVAAIERRARRQGERPPPLRSRERVLSSSGSIARWSTPAPTFPTPERHARGRADREDGSRVPEARAAAGRTRRRSRLRLGSAGAASWRSELRRARFARSTSRASRSPTRGSGRAREGLDDRVEFVEDDYRNVRGQYDAFVSVGMLEHVGAARLSGAGRA